MDNLALRRLRAKYMPPCVTMTANAMQVDQHRWRKAGMVDFVSKPIAPDALWRVLLHWLPERAALAVSAFDCSDPLTLLEPTP